MKKSLRILTIIFDPEIKKSQIPGFRGAIIKKIGKEHILFHNHFKDNFRYQYPLVQYKTIGKKASIICIDKAIDDLYALFNNNDWKINIYEENLELKISRLFINRFNMNVWDKMFDYNITTWLALNEKNDKIYKELKDEADKINLLEKILTANILSFAKGIDWYIKDKKIKVKIKKIKEEGFTKFKGLPKRFFSVDFKTNVFLPNYIGLGKAASRGFGTVYMPNTKRLSRT